MTISLIAATAAEAKPDKPPAEAELLTETQEAVLRNEAVKVQVRSRRGREARVKAGLVVDGFDDFSFRLGPESRRLRDREARLIAAQRPPGRGAGVRRAGLRRRDADARGEGRQAKDEPRGPASRQGLLVRA